jgi:hypothetical protein
MQVSLWEGLFEAGSDNNSHADFSHEVAADDDYYFAGDFTALGGPNQTQPEVFNDDADTNTAAGRTGDPSIGFERALTETDPQTRIWFTVPPEKGTPVSRLRVSVELLQAISPGGGSNHTIEISLNGRVVRTESNVTSPRLIQFETSGAVAELQPGPNVMQLHRTGGSAGGYVTFDYVMLEWLPGTSTTVTGIVDDPILGTRTVYWDATPGGVYRVQKSADGVLWENLAIGFPTGGSPGTALFFEDRLTPLTDPQPQYRVIVE